MDMKVQLRDVILSRSSAISSSTTTENSSLVVAARRVPASLCSLDLDC